MKAALIAVLLCVVLVVVCFIVNADFEVNIVPKGITSGNQRFVLTENIDVGKEYYMLSKAVVDGFIIRDDSEYVSVKLDDLSNDSDLFKQGANIHFYQLKDSNKKK